MDRHERAKQFLSFDALKGLKEELKKREERHTRVEKTEISDEAREEICSTLAVIAKGAEVKIIFYYLGHYIETTAVVEKINFNEKTISFGGNKILFDDIYSIKILSF